MSLTNHQKIGTHFKKENIFLATVYATEKNTKRLLNDEALEALQEALEKAGTEISRCTMFDVFYKEGDVYLRFYEDGVETYVGDNSDGMGTLRNVVSVWAYFSDDELFETQLADGTMAIRCTNQEPLYRYIHNSTRNKNTV